MRRSKWIALLLAGMLAAGMLAFVGGCGSKSSAGTIKVGAVLSMSGPNEPLGDAERQAIDLFVEQLNAGGGIDGFDIEVVFEDDRSDANVALEAVNTLLEQDDIVAIIGSSGTGPTLSMKNATTAASIAQVGCAAGNSVTASDFEWIFRTPPKDSTAVEHALGFISENLGKTKVAVLYDNNPFGKDGLRVITEMIGEFGIELVATEAYETNETEEGMDTHLTRIQGSNPEVLLVWGTNPGPAKIASRMKAKGMTIPFVGSHGIANKKFVSDAGAAAEGVYFPAGKVLVWEDAMEEGHPQRDVVEAFWNDYSEKYGMEADTFAGHGWDAIAIIADAIERAGTDTSDLAAYRVKLRDAIEETKDLAGIGGVFTYSSTDHDSLTADDLIMIKVVDGEYTAAE
ncbi:MAG: ABC transporter substrate-binding protein [Candidatus Geothermincolia bacterium]